MLKLCLCVLTLLETALHFGTCELSSARVVDEDAFSIQHSRTTKCMGADPNLALSLVDCDPNSAAQLWKWGVGRRLFHTGTSLCLAMELRSKKVSLVDCGSSGPMWWQCADGALHTTYQMALVFNDNDSKFIAKRENSDTWVIQGSQSSVCSKSYRVVHTINGNSAGLPCEFPFKYNNSWHHGCLPDPESPGLSWCSITSDYDDDRKMGQCLLPEDNCRTLFNGPEGNSCFEFVSNAAVTWHAALDSCRSQGADLLSLTELDDLNSSTLLNGLAKMPEKMWIGLHQLDTSQGWQWSDGSPLTLLRWEEGMPPASLIIEADCGVLNSKKNYEAEACDKHLPYICKKKLHAPDPTAAESLTFNETVCQEGWVPWSGFCYKLVKDAPQNFTLAQTHCSSSEGGAVLASFHSIDSKEMISTHFYTANQTLEAWIGLTGVGTNPATFKWTDQQPVTFTYWGQSQPQQPVQDSSCVFLSGELHGWKVGECSQKLPFMCQKKGEVSESKTVAGCKFEDGWRRHGSSCYKVNTTQVFFRDHCNITIRNRFEQAFINRLLREHISAEPRYFWIAMQDAKNTGEYQWVSPNGSSPKVTYTNWGWQDPAHDGGCVVISTGKPLGNWEVKNCTLFKAGTICKTDLSAPPPPEPEPDPSAPCHNGWESDPKSKYCYKVFHEERLSRKRSWVEAQKFCQALGANLPSFTTVEEMLALHSVTKKTITDDRYFWVGLNRRNPADYSWRWSDGRPVALDVLHQNFQEDDVYSRDCTAFKTMRSGLKHLLMYMLHDIVIVPFYARPFHCDAQLGWLCQIPRGIQPKNPEWYNPDAHHESSLFMDQAEFWFVKEPRLTFQEASLYCKSNGSFLAAPTSLDAFSKIQVQLKELSNSKQSWWIDMRQTGRFLPPSVPHRYFYHAFLLGRCTALSYEKSNLSAGCQLRYPFVCQTQTTTSLEKNPEKPTDKKPCEKGTVSFRNKCFTLMKYANPISFKSASEECQTVQGTLVSISDQVEQDFINTLLQKMKQKKMIWIGLKIRPGNSSWLDQSQVKYLNFNPLLLGMQKKFNPLLLASHQMDMCVFLINNSTSEMLGTWDFNHCTEQQSLGICQRYTDQAEETQVSKDSFQVNSYTFQPIFGNLTWFDAVGACRNLDMELTSVPDSLVQSYLSVYVHRANTPMWIGLHSRDNGVNYVWMDHSHTVFSRWSPELSEGSCVYQDTDGFWKATECLEELGGAMCYKPNYDIIRPPDPESIKCPHAMNGPNWIPWGKNCYTFLLVPSRWDAYKKNKIQETCSKLYPGADLLTIRNEEENEFVQRTLQQFQSLVQFVWLAMFRDETDNQLRWYDGTRVQYSKWEEGRPDVDSTFMAGLTAEGIWTLWPDEYLHSEFKQKTIVSCKLDNESKQQFNRSSKDFSHYGNLTYDIITRKLTWHQAVRECSERNGHLASIHDFNHDLHVGLLAKTDGFKLWLGLSRHGAVYEWSDGTKLDYTPDGFDLKTAEDSGQLEARCAFINPNGTWMTSGCDAVMEGAICYTTSITTASQRAKLTAAPEPNHCPQGDRVSSWVQHQDHCYALDMSLYNYTVHSEEQAGRICQDMDAELLTITSKEENDFLTKYIIDNPLITSQLWLAVKLDAQGKPVSWQDGSDLIYSNWNPTPTALSGQSEPQCAVMVAAEGGNWSRISCKSAQSRVVCKSQAKSGGSPVALGLFIVVLISLTLTAGFVLYKKKRHYFTSTIRYQKTLDHLDSTSIITEAEE